MSGDLDPAALFGELERLVKRIDEHLVSDPQLTGLPSGMVMSALLVLAGGMAGSGNAPFPELVQHAAVLLRVGYEHQQRERHG